MQGTCMGQSLSSCRAAGMGEHLDFAKVLHKGQGASTLGSVSEVHYPHLHRIYNTTEGRSLPVWVPKAGGT